jgi:endonuclease/exonuclease/phosphatase (EEP) superfamily protein YafD
MKKKRWLRAVIALYLALDEPAILVGDMNSDADDPQIRQLSDTPGVDDPVGGLLGPEILEKDAPRRIDWIFTRGLRCVDAGIRDDGASDHPMIWAELELPPQDRWA